MRWWLPAVFLLEACSLLYPLDFSGGDAGTGSGGGFLVGGGGTSGGTAGGSTSGGSAGGSTSGGSAGGSTSGGTAGGSTSGGSAGGSTSGGTAGGSTSGGSAGGGTDGGTNFCDRAPAGAHVCLDFEVPPPALVLTAAGSPSNTIVADVIADAGRPGRVWRVTSPQVPSAGFGGAYLQLALPSTPRRFLLSFELNLNTVPTDISYVLYAFSGGATAQLHGDSSGVSVFTTGGPAIDGTGGFGTGWRHVEWLVDFNDGGTRVEVGGVPVITHSLGALVTTGATGAREIRVGIPFRSPFDVGVQVLMDDVLVTTP